MLSNLRQPKWAIAGVVVVGLAGLFVFLGNWQLDRHQERLAENRHATAQLAEPAVPLTELLRSAGGDLASIEYRRVTVDGTYVLDDEVLTRSQVHLGTAGFHVITPYVYPNNTVLVNRGWVPLGMDTPPVDAPPVTGPIEGWIHLTQERGALSPEDAPGKLAVFSRVDVERIDEQTSAELDPVYLVLIEDDTGQLPVPLDLPDFSDAGPHLAYAIQWFGFALIGVIGFALLLRKQSSR